ncbi:MAG: PilZ domain-containing protein [Desulfobacca sp.]|nr:PilZ domain-containing protein [Desulfobacca sp.]
MPGQQSRKSRRYAIRLELKEINGKPGAGTYLLDLSATGAKLDSPTAFALNNPVKITFIFPGENKEICLGGRVVWVLPLMGKASRYLIGLQLFQSFWELDLLARRLQNLIPK